MFGLTRFPDISALAKKTDITAASTCVFAWANKNQISQTITNSAAEAAWNFGADCIIPANTLTPGCVIRVRQQGVYQSGLSQSILPRVRLGQVATAMTSRTIIATTGAYVSGLLNAASDTPWAADTDHLVLTNGLIVPSGKLFFSTSATAALMALVAQTAGVSGVDRTVPNVLTASAQWNAAMNANQITCTVFQVEVFRPKDA